MRQIARTLGRAPSTISREVGGNRGRRKYRAVDADDRAWRRARRPKRCLLAASPELRAYVAARLREDWSPEQIAGTLRKRYQAGAASNLRAHSESEVGAPVVTGGPHAAAISESSERQRAAKSRRCSARGIESPRPRRQRKYCRNSSNAEQKRAADAKLPKPRIG